MEQSNLARVPSRAHTPSRAIPTWTDWLQRLPPSASRFRKQSKVDTTPKSQINPPTYPALFQPIRLIRTLCIRVVFRCGRLRLGGMLEVALFALFDLGGLCCCDFLLSLYFNALYI